MTKLEFALVMKIIDAHTTVQEHNYDNEVGKTIKDVQALKADMIRHYEDVMKEDNE